jgi:phage-related protein
MPRSALRNTPLSKPSRASAGRSVLEIVAPYESDTYRAVYTVRFKDAIYVLHAFQKKSKRGIATPKPDMDLIRQRLADAARLHEQRRK